MLAGSFSRGAIYLMLLKRVKIVSVRVHRAHFPALGHSSHIAAAERLPAQALVQQEVRRSNGTHHGDSIEADLGA